MTTRLSVAKGERNLQFLRGLKVDHKGGERGDFEDPYFRRMGDAIRCFANEY